MTKQIFKRRNPSKNKYNKSEKNKYTQEKKPGHVLLRMKNTRICAKKMIWHPYGRRKVGRTKTTWSRSGYNWVGISGLQQGQQSETKAGGGSALRPYMPVGTMRIGKMR